MEAPQCSARSGSVRCHKLEGHTDEHHNLVMGHRWLNPVAVATQPQEAPPNVASASPDEIRPEVAESVARVLSSRGEALAGLERASKSSHLSHFDPNPRPLEPAQNGYIWCAKCDCVRPATGHECLTCRFGHRHMTAALAAECAHDGIPDEHLRWRQAESRAEFAESLLCAMAFDHGRRLRFRHGEAYCYPDPAACVFCDAGRAT